MHGLFEIKNKNYDKTFVAIGGYLSQGASNKLNENALMTEKDKIWQPTYKNAHISDEKIFSYSLDKRHTKGRHKAIAFELALGYNQSNGDKLLENVKSNFEKFPLVEKNSSEYGRRFESNMILTGINGKEVKVKACWIKDNGKDFLRLTNLYVDK